MELSDLHKEILVACANEETGLWAILWRINGGGYSKNAPLAQGVREKAVGIIRDLLEGGLIEGGFPQLPAHVETELHKLQQQNPRQGTVIATLLKNNPPTWKPFDHSASDTIGYIQREWDNLQHEPNIGDIIWFRTTAAGAQIAKGFMGK
jgi:hypothetical protein